MPESAASLMLSANDGLVIDCAFGTAGHSCPQAEAVWTWKNYALANAHARRSIEAHPTLPEPARATLLSPDDPLHIDYNDGWLHGAILDASHKHYAGAGEFGYFRFAFNEVSLVTARRHPLQSVDDVWRMVESRRKSFRRPAELVEAIIVHALERLSREMADLSVELDAIEDNVVGGSWHREGDRLAVSRRKLIHLHRHAAAIRAMFRHLEHLHQDELTQELADMIVRLANRSVALLRESEQMQSRARLLQDEMMARLTAESNRLLYVLSMLTAVLLPMTIISGLFGMNVDGMPFADNPAGFWSISAISALVAAGVFLAMRHIGRR